ncbi:hypothetical protein BP6252_06203 [Coleophoma cylindrospora]|uniref:Uncharacterized protein n=1 Tax=Coleophoma cylindrospora TaxID=1849047 RepID=A0A3D8RMN6_9HELO|nr:hypothetical protein BP6252_06203 [Coleophoma cylindrospora]
MSPTNFVHLTTRSLRLRATVPKRAITSPILPLQTRTLFQSAILTYPRKDSQDRESINTDATEYTKSGTDDTAAHEVEAAFDPKLTSPEGEKKKAGEGNDQNPLEVSPANREVSKQGGKEAHGGSEESAGSKKRSGSGSPPKAGKP